jgi:GT2 family glycosyltransferase
MEETQTAPPQVSVLIVSYNRAEALRRCLAALEQSEARETFEILVVDNGSQDGSVAVIAEFPNVTPLHLPRNFGFTKALNIGMRTAKGEFFLFLNPRTEVLPGAVPALAAELAAQSAAVAAAPLLTTADGEPAPHLYRLPQAAEITALARAGRFEPSPAPDTAAGPKPVDFAGFSALMVRGYFLKGLRYIDEHYAQSWADAEIAAQIRRAAKKTILVPEARAIWREEDGLRAGMPGRARALLAADWALGAAQFSRKHFGFAAGLRVRLGSAISALASFELRKFSYVVSGQKIDGTQSEL